jgi:hypothetical protein
MRYNELIENIDQADDDELFGTRLSASLAQRFDFPEDGDLGYTLGGGGVEYGNGHQTEGLVIVSRGSSSIAFIPDFTYFDDEPTQEDLEFLFYDDDTERTPLTRQNIDKFMSLEEETSDEELFGKSKPGFVDFETADKLARTLRKFMAVFVADPEMIEFKQEKPQQYAKILNDFVIAYNYLKIGNAFGAIAAIEREPMGYDLDEWAFNYIEKLSHIDLRNMFDREDDDTYDAIQKAFRELPPSTATLDESDDDMFGAKPTGRYWSDTPEEFQQYWNALVPSEGPAKTVQGELLRAANKIYYDYYNNGFGNNWSGAMKFIHQHLGHAPGLATLAPFSAGRMPRGAAQEKQIEIALDQMMDTVMATVRRANGEYQPNSTDMYSLSDKREYNDDDEEDVYDYDDYDDDDDDEEDEDYR